jgi:xanthine/CO dehydrogenase XdhC/CoxF family maturation factor
MKELLEIIGARAAQPGLPYALATVVKVMGSSYRRPGARMLIGARGRLAGSVSGGCLERDVISRGLAVILSGEAQIAVYDTSDQDDMAFGTSLGCEGRIEIFIEPVLPDRAWPLAEVAERIRREHRPGALALVYRSEGTASPGTLVFRAGADMCCWPEWKSAPAGLEDDLAQVAATKKPLSQTYATADGKIDVLLQRIAPPLRLVLFGGGHDVPPLVRLAKELGHEVAVVDRRADFAEAARFPGADRVVHARPADAAARVPLDADAAVVIMNHHYETDAELLGLMLQKPLTYLGMLGPRKRTARILEELREKGAAFTEAQMEKLHAPAGLDLGSENPEQIALCILAEIQAALNGRSGTNLRDRQGPIGDRPGGAKSSL